MKTALYFLALAAAVVAMLFGAAWIANQAITGGREIAAGVSQNSPSQAEQLGNYVLETGINPIQAQTVYTLAEADATVRYSQNDQIEAMAEKSRAEAEVYRAETERLEMIRSIVPGIVSLIQGIGITLAIICIVALILRVKNGDNNEK